MDLGGMSLGEMCGGSGGRSNWIELWTMDYDALRR